MRSQHGIMVIVDEPVGKSPSEAVDRAIGLALGLANDHSVLFCSTVGITAPPPGLVARTLSRRGIYLYMALTSLTIATRTAAGRLPRARRGPVCVDLGSFLPSDFSVDTCQGVRPGDESLPGERLRLTNAALRSGDFFVCAGEEDRAGWLGALAAAGRIRAHLYDVDPKLRCLLDVASLERPPHLAETSEKVPDAVRRYCESPWRNPRPGR